MNTSTRRLLSGLAIAATLLVGQGGSALAASPSPVSSQPTGPTGNEMLSVQPSVISVSAKPGSTANVELTLRAAAELSVAIRSQGLSQGTDGGFKAVAGEQDTSTFSARTMLTASPETLQVKPGDQIKLNVTITVPADVGEGTRYAILTITGMPNAPTGSSNVGFGVELGVSTIVQIASTNQVKTGEIKNIAVGQTLPGQPLPVAVSFLNTGNTHYGAIPNELLTTATLQDASGHQLAVASASGNQLSVIPSFSRDVALPMAPAQAMVDGATYHLEVGVGLKDGTVFDRKALDFTWAGGQVLGATSAPIETPPATASPNQEMGLIIAAALAGAIAVAALFLLLPRLRRRLRREPKVADQ